MAAPQLVRPVLLPALLTVVVLLATAAAVGTDLYGAVRFGVAIFAAIVAVMLAQWRLWWWLVVPVAIAVFWNPVLPVELPMQGQQTAHFAAAAALIVVAVAARSVPRD